MPSPSAAQRKAGTNPAQKTDAKAIERMEREVKALELRKAGVPFYKIAQQLGWADGAGAHKAVKRAMERTLQEPADELRALESERLDALFLAAWKTAVQGDLKAIDRAIRIIELRAKLFGLATVPTAQGDDHAVSVIGQIGAALQAAAGSFAEPESVEG